jgi:hypothetical protein
MHHADLALIPRWELGRTKKRKVLEDCKHHCTIVLCAFQVRGKVRANSAGKEMLTEACLSKINSGFEGREAPGQRLWPSRKRCDPALSLQVRMKGTTAFMPYKMSNEVGGFVPPVRRLVLKGERYLEGME